MKKIISVILCTALLLCCFAGCTPNEEENAAQPMVGYGRASIVPDFSMPIGGYPGPENRWFTNVLDPLYVTAIAFTDQDNNTVILMQYDLGKCNNMSIAWAMKDISEKYGIPRVNIVASATHTHSSPHDSAGGEAISERWSDLLRQQTVAAATQAMESRLLAEIYGGSIDTVNLNFIRHYVMEDGSLAGDNFGDTSLRAVKHTQPVDPQLRLLRFKRQGGKDVIMANFQAHPLLTGGAVKPDLSSDFIGPMTVYMEENLNCHFAYFSGASGNVDSSSWIGGENIAGSNHVMLGQMLGQQAELVCSNLQKLDSGAVRIAEAAYSPNNASGSPSGTEITQIAFSVGDVGFINVPYEMFCSNGKYVKDNSPFAMTFVTYLGYGSGSYIPDAATFAYDVDSYEESQCPYEAGTGEKLAEGFVALLNQLHGADAAE